MCTSINIWYQQKQRYFLMAPSCVTILDSDIEYHLEYNVITFET